MLVESFGTNKPLVLRGLVVVLIDGGEADDYGDRGIK
jgi:hypothetical protein